MYGDFFQIMFLRKTIQNLNLRAAINFGCNSAQAKCNKPNINIPALKGLTVRIQIR
jgi:hypothetical protein